MSTLKSNATLTATMFAGLFVIAGCATDSTEQQESAAASTEQKVVYSTQFSQKGTLTIYEGEQGQLNLSVTGAIGEDDEAAVSSALDQPTLIETVRQLKGDSAELSPNLKELSDRLAIQVAAARAEARTLAAEQPAQESVDLQAAEATTKDFYSDNCKVYWDFNGGNYKYTPIFCQLASCPNGYRGSCSAAPSSAIMVAADRSYAYNASSVNAVHFIPGYQTQTQATVPPGAWHIGQWYSMQGKFLPSLAAQVQSGQLWNTVHQWSVVIY
jgi:hypothetical protein